MGIPLGTKLGTRKPIDWDEFDKLCAIHCTLVEIAEWFKVSDDTIERAVEREHGIKFAEYFKRKSGTGKMSLRRKMYQTAMQGNVTMMIFLSKQLLGFADKHEQTATVVGVAPKEVTRAELKAILASDPILNEQISGTVS
jgi:hypothetical protein